MKLLAFAAIVAFCGAEKLDRTYLPPPGAKLSGGSPGAINTPHGSTGSEPDYQKFLTPPVESDSSVPFSREPSQSSLESSGVQRPGVSFEQGTQQSSIGSRPLSKDAPSMSISQGGNQRIQGLQDTTRPGGEISHESRPGLDSSSAMPGSNERFPNSNTDSRYPGSRPSFRDSVPSIPTYQGSGQHIQSSLGRPFSQGSRPSISDSLSTVPISEGTIQRFPEENLPTRSETSFTQGSRPSLSDFTPAAPINQNADQPISNYNGQSSLGPSRSPSVFSGSTSQVPNLRIPGFNGSARPEIAIMEGSRPSLTDSKLIDSQPSYGQDSSRRPLGNRYDSPLETVTTPSKINNQESSQHRARPDSNYETKPISKPDQAYDTPKNSLPNQYIPSSERNQQTYDSPVSQQTTNYQNDNRRGQDGGSNRLPYQDNRASAAFPNGAGSQSPISDTRYQKPSSGKVLPQGNGPVRGPSIGLPTSQDSGSKLPSKGGDAMFESEATSSPIETDVDYDDDIAISGIDSNGNPEIPSTENNAEGDQSPLIKSGLRNQNNRYVQNVDRPQAALERTAGIIRYKNVINPDGTFAYDFETENGIKAQEHGTSANGVQAEGDFSYVGDDGQVYSITYTADERGYQPQGDHLPTSPPIPDAILRSLEIIAQQEAAGELDDGSYDEHKYGPAQFGVGNDNEESNRLIQESRGNDDFEPRTKTENENDDDLDSIEIKAAEPGSNDYDYNSADNEQHLNQAQRPNYGSRPESSSSINGEGNKYFRAGNTPKTNIGRHGVTSEPRRFETTTSSISRRPSFNGLSESASRNTESPSSLKYTTSDSQTLSPGNRNYQTNPSTPGFEYTTILPDFSVPAVRGSQSIYPKTSQDYRPVKPGNGVPVSQGNRPNVNKRPQVAYSPTVVDSKNEDKVYSREMLPKSSTQYLPAKQGSLSPNNRYQDQDTQPKITSEYTSFVPGKFGSDISQKQQPHYSVEYKSPQVYPSLSSNEDYQTNSPTTSLQYTTHVPIMGERKYQKTLPKSSLMYIPSAPGSLPTENQDYDESLPKQSSEDRPPARGSSPLDVTRYQTSTKSPISEVRNYQNGFPKAALQNTASPEGTRNNVGNIHPGNEYEGDINKSMVNTIIPGADRNKPERIQESIYSNNRGPNKFNRPEYGSTTTQRQPFLDETKDQGGVRYSQELNGQPISQFNTQSPNTQAIRLTTIRPSQYQTGDVTLENFNGATKSPYVPNHYENIKVTKGPFRAVTTIMPEINQEYEAEDNYNIQPSRDIEGDFGRRTESRPQYNISSKHIMQTSNPDIDNEDGYNYQVPKTHFNHHQYSSSPQHFNQPDRGQGQTDKPTGEDYGTTVGNRNIYTTTISPGSTQRNKYPSVTTIRPQSSTTFRNDVNSYNEAPNSEELNNSGIDGNDNSRPNYVRNNQPNQPFSQQTSSQYNPSDRNLNGRPQNRPTSQQYNRFSPQSELQAQGPQDDGGNPELHGESILEGQLDGTSQRPFGRPQSNTSKAYPQSGGNGHPRPTPFVKEFPASNTFIGAGEKFPESRRPPSYSPEAGYKY